jgi:hypothetical protein
MKKLNILTLLCIISVFFAAGISAQDSIFAGIGAEVNANTREGIAAAGVFSFGMDLNHQFAAGLNLGYSNNLEKMSALEASAFFRYYLPLNIEGLFVQALAGYVIFFEDGETGSTFLGGLALGWRFKLGSNFYLEPTVRGGHPFMWGVGLTAGFIRVRS